MSEQEVNVQDEKQDTTATAGEKQSVDQVPYARFKELVDEKNELKAQIDEINKKVKSEADEREQSELEKKGEYETLVADLKTKLEAATSKADAFDSYQSSRREALLSKLDEDDRAIYEDMSLEKLEAHIDKVSTRPVNVPSGKPGRGDHGGYDNAVEFALKDPEGYKKSREGNKKSSVWNNLFES